VIYGYFIRFPTADEPPAEGPSIEVVTNKTWEQSCEVYEIDEASRACRFTLSVGDATHSSSGVLPPEAHGRLYLVRLMHKEGTPDGSMPWLSSNNVLLHHGPQNAHEQSNPLYRAMNVTIIGDDGNEQDFNDTMVYVSFESACGAGITAVTEPLAEDHVVPPEAFDLPPDTKY